MPVCSTFILHHATGTPYKQNRTWKKHTHTFSMLFLAKYHRNLIVLLVRNCIFHHYHYSTVRAFLLKFQSRSNGASSLSLSRSVRACVRACIFVLNLKFEPPHFFSGRNFSRTSFINSNRFLWIHDFWLLFNKSHSIHTLSAPLRSIFLSRTSLCLLCVYLCAIAILYYSIKCQMLFIECGVSVCV